jgi:calcineurin-like phosphoesterase family protein
MKSWLTSDTHFGHANIIAYSRRPFADVQEMNRELIRRWNDIVGPRDVVYHLGDFAMGSPSEWCGYCKKLRGRKILVRGNHDRKADFMREVGFDEVYDNIVVEIDGVRVWMNHYPAESHDARDLKRPAPPAEYDIPLCGHVHRAFEVHADVVNVGADVWDYQPTTLERIQQRLRDATQCE